MLDKRTSADVIQDTTEFMASMQQVSTGQDSSSKSGYQSNLQLATEAAWGTIWTRPGLELKQRSLIVIVLLMSQGKEAEVRDLVGRSYVRTDGPQVCWTSEVSNKSSVMYCTHLGCRGAVKNGCTELEIQEAMLQTSVYCGIPTGVSMFRVADGVIKQLKEEGLLKK